MWCLALTGQEQQQPIPFSHKAHAAVALKCSECHPNPDPGEAMTIPATAKCMQCRVAVAKEKPAIQKLTAYARNKEEVPWVRVYTVPDWVFWSHRTHTEGKVGCASCHGDVAESDVVVRVTNVTTMGGCVACHQKSGAATGCQTCHEDRHS